MSGTSDVKKHFARLFLGISLLCGTAMAGDFDTAIQQADGLLKDGKAKEAAVAYRDLLVKYKKVLPSYPGVADLWDHFGTALTKIGKADDAKKAFERAAEHRKKVVPPQKGEEKIEAVAAPKNPEPTSDMTKYSLPGLKEPKAMEHYRRAMAYLEDKHTTFAAQELIQAVDVSPECPELLSLTGVLLADLGDQHMKRAREILEKLSKLNKDKLTIEERLALAKALLYSEKPEFERAEALLKSVLENEAKHVGAMLLAGEIKLVRGDPQAAFDQFKKAAEAAKSDYRPLLGLGRASLDLKKNDEALDFLRQAQGFEPRNPLVILTLGKAFIRLGRTVEGSASLRQAIDLDPSNIDARLELVDIQLQKNRDMSASEHLDAVLEMDPGNPRVQFYNGWFLEIRGLLTDCVRAYRVATAAGGEIGLRAKLRLADIYAGIGQSFPGNPFSNERPECRRQYETMANSGLAWSYFNEVIKANPNHPEAARIKAWITEQEPEMGKAADVQSVIQSQFSG